MRRLKRKHCAVLRLVLKKPWYDMIASGEKREEYRDATRYWTRRIRNVAKKAMELIGGKGKLPVVIAFSCGYTKADMFFECDGITRHFEYSVRCTSPRMAWGEPDTSHYVIKLGERVELED